MTLNESNLEKRFNAVSTSQGSIQSLSFFCLHYKAHHKKIAQIWLRCLQKAKIHHRLTLIYLANDIVQNAKRKNATFFIDDFKNILKETIPYLRDEKIKKSVERVFSIWQDRAIFDGRFTSELKDSLNNISNRAQNNNDKPVVEHLTSKYKTNDLLDSLTKLASIEKNFEKIKSTENNIVDRLEQGTVRGDDNDSKTLSDLKNFIIHIKTEIDERSRLAKMLEEVMVTQKKLLKDSEEQLLIYKTQLDYIIKLRDDLN